jgi:hypothetical protein
LRAALLAPAKTLPVFGGTNGPAREITARAHHDLESFTMGYREQSLPREIAIV